MSYTTPPKALVFKLTNGLFIHLADVTAISAKQFDDEQGVISALADGGSAGHAIYVRHGSDQSGVIDLADPYSSRSTGIDPNGYVAYNDVPNSDKAERELTVAWGHIRHPEFKDYYRSYQ